MFPKDPERPYKGWPGYEQLRRRLETFDQVVKLNVTGSAFVRIELVPARAPKTTVYSVWARDLNMVFPFSREELERLENSFGISFQPSNDECKAVLQRIVGRDFVRYPMHKVAFWAHSGPSNSVSCVYHAQALNEGSAEVYLQSLGVGVYEFGLHAGGNLFDGLLLADFVQKR